MITLIEETRVVVNGSAAYVLDLQFDTAAELEKLPKIGKPFDSNNFPIGFDYGVPANGSIATCLGTSKTYVFSSTNGWQESGGSGSIGHKVTFIVGNTTRYVYDVADGESITEPSTPSESGKIWFGWWTNATMIGGTKISFPYTPTVDITLYGILDTFAGMTWRIPQKNSDPYDQKYCGFYVMQYSLSGSYMGTPNPNSFMGLGIAYHINYDTGALETAYTESDYPNMVPFAEASFTWDAPYRVVTVTSTPYVGKYASNVYGDDGYIDITFISGQATASTGLRDFLYQYGGYRIS